MDLPTAKSRRLRHSRRDERFARPFDTGSSRADWGSWCEVRSATLDSSHLEFWAASGVGSTQRLTADTCELLGEPYDDDDLLAFFGTDDICELVKVGWGHGTRDSDSKGGR